MPAVDQRDLDTSTREEAGYSEIPVAITNASRMKDLRNDLVEYILKNYPLKVPYQATLEVYGDPDEDRSKFEAAVRQAAREQRDDEVEKVTESFEKKIDRLEESLRKKEAELKKDKAKASGGSQDLLAAGVSGALSLLQGRSATSMINRVTRKFGQRGEYQAEVEEGEKDVQAVQEQLDAMSTEFEQELQAVQAKWDAELQNITEKEITALKKNVQVQVFGLGWVPYYAFTSEGRFEFVAAFKQAES